MNVYKIVVSQVEKHVYTHSPAFNWFHGALLGAQTLPLVPQKRPYDVRYTVQSAGDGS